VARPAKIEDSVLLKKLSDVFRDTGYEGASLTLLSEATGLKKASLYHRFPNGKEQMAAEVMNGAQIWLTENILNTLQSSAPPAERIRAMIQHLDVFYSGGTQACLLNMLSSPQAVSGPLAEPIGKAFKAWIDALARAIVDAGFEDAVARFRAERAIALIQGSLVLARGMNSTQPFQNCLANLERELLAS
jgi:AcrR family transcriptional regulator